MRRRWRGGSRTGPCAVLGQIRSLHASTFDNSLQEQLRAERSAQEMTLETHDCVEGVRAFFEKREPASFPLHSSGTCKPDSLFDPAP